MVWPELDFQAKSSGAQLRLEKHPSRMRRCIGQLRLEYDLFEEVRVDQGWEFCFVKEKLKEPLQTNYLYHESHY